MSIAWSNAAPIGVFPLALSVGATKSRAGVKSVATVTGPNVMMAISTRDWATASFWSSL